MTEVNRRDSGNRMWAAKRRSMNAERKVGHLWKCAFAHCASQLVDLVGRVVFLESSQAGHNVF